jgi:hypothetical protein
VIHLDALADAPHLTAKQLAKKHGDEGARWATLQLELRKRARVKFANPDAMLFDREALEQATHSTVAAYHAARFPLGARVIDLTTGIGGDLLALAARGPSVGFEINPERAEIAQFNVPNADVKNEDGFAWLKDNTPDYVWVDPHRRAASGKRFVSPDDYQPNPRELAARLATTRLSGMKLSPMLGDDYLLSLGGRLEFVSHQGECGEAVVWLGSDTVPGKFAVVLADGLPHFYEPREVEKFTNEPSQYLVDLDPAIIRAHAIGNFEGSELGDIPGYLTLDTPPKPAIGARIYEVKHHGSGDLRRTKALLREHKLRVFEVKQRGAGLDPAKVMQELKTEGDPVSLVAFRVGKSIRFALCVSV